MKQFAAILCATLVTLAYAPTVSSQEIRFIGAAELLAWFDAPEPPLLLDVRGRQAYLEGTLPGAFNAGKDPAGYLPGDSGEPLVLIAAEPLDRSLVESWRSRLVNAGHQVWLLSGGIAAWRNVGGWIETPDTSYSQPGRVPFLIPRGLCEGGEPAQVFR